MYREERKAYIIQCMAMNLSEVDSIAYLKDRGIDISASHLYRIKKQIKDSRFDRLHLIAKQELVDQHLDRIDSLLTIEKELWALYHKESNTFKKAMILRELRELQQWITAFYDASICIYEKSVRERRKRKLESESLSYQQ